MVAPIYSNRKGIYKDLYREIDADNKKKEASQVKKQPKGIYKDLYRQLDENKSVSFKVKQKEDDENIWHTYPLKTMAYSNDIGEALRPIVGGLLAKLSWIPTIMYALLSILSQCFSLKEKNSNNVSRELLFQLLASFLLPILLVKSVGKATNKILDNVSLKAKEKLKTSIQQVDWLNKLFKKAESKKANGYRNVCVSTAGVFALALAVRPIDNFVDKSLDRVYNRG